MIMNIVSELVIFDNINWDFVIILMGLIGDLCLFFVAIYTFRLTVLPKKLKFIGLSYQSSLWDGEAMEFILENRSISPVIVRSLDMIVDSQLVQVYRGSCIIDGFKTKTIRLEPYLQIIAEGEVIDISVNPDVTLYVETSRGKYYVKQERVNSFIYRLNKRRLDRFTKTTVVRHYYNGKLIPINTKYVLSYKEKDESVNTIFIDESGLMSDTIFEFNSLPKEILEREEDLRSIFDAEFEKRKIPYSLDKYRNLYT